MPNEHNNWINHRNSKFSEYIPLAPEKKFDANAQAFFLTRLLGTATNRDSWSYSFSKNEIEKQIGKIIEFYNQQTEAYQEKRQKRHRIDYGTIPGNPHKESGIV